MAEPIGVLGDGLIRRALLDRLGPRARAADGPDCACVIVVSDAWDTGTYDAVRDRCAPGAIPWLPVRTELGQAVVGPLEIAGVPGCCRCAEIRREAAHPDATGQDAVRVRHAERLAAEPSALLTALAADLVAALAVESVLAAATDPDPDSDPDSDPARCRGAYLRVDLATLAVTTHRFLPDPWCPVCGALPDDSADSAEMALASRPKSAPDEYRVGAAAPDLDQLTALYVDPDAGLVRAVADGSLGDGAMASAELGLRAPAGLERGFGSGPSYRDSRLTAILEALERYGGTRPGGRRTSVRGSRAALGDVALDPRVFGLYPPDRYELPDFPYRPYSDEEVCDWVWAYSFARREPVLLPETLAYFRTARTGRETVPFAYETSNGCALGSCLEEAILHGLLEAAERDAFLLTWYAQMSAPRLDLASARRPGPRALAESVAAETGYLVHVFDITVAEAVPCVWAVAVNPAEEGRPALACAAGSHPVPERAAERALGELRPALASLLARYPGNAERARTLARDPSQVLSMDDHSLLYGFPGVADRLGFLLKTTAGGHRFADVPGDGTLDYPDLRSDLTALVDRYVGAGLDVVVVDQSAPEHRAAGLSCVKVLIPGTLPMTFGHANRRVEGLPRLLEAPRVLGRRDRALAPDEINPHPHPFP